jgi:hypothetical protein
VLLFRFISFVINPQASTRNDHVEKDSPPP